MEFGRPILLSFGQVKEVYGMAAPKDTLYLLYSCPCEDCLMALEDPVGWDTTNREAITCKE